MAHVTAMRLIDDSVAYVIISPRARYVWQRLAAACQTIVFGMGPIRDIPMILSEGCMKNSFRTANLVGCSSKAAIAYRHQ
jgi:hypothetical protein